MDSAIGWLLDVTVERNAATLWIMLKQGGILRLVDKYQSCCYILPRNEQAGTELFHILQQHNARVEWQSKHADIDHDGYERLLCVYLESTYYCNTLVKRLQNDPRVALLLNMELSHLQQYLFTRLKVEPTFKVRVEYDNEHLISLIKIDEHEGGAQPPLLSSLYSLDSHDVNDPIKQISRRTRGDICRRNNPRRFLQLCINQ